MDALKAGDFNAFGNLIADEAVFVDAFGPASKAEVLKHTEGFKLTDYKIEDEKFLPISADTGLISYYVTEKGSSQVKNLPLTCMSPRSGQSEQMVGSVYSARKRR